MVWEAFQQDVGWLSGLLNGIGEFGLWEEFMKSFNDAHESNPNEVIMGQRDGTDWMFAWMAHMGGSHGINPHQVSGECVGSVQFGRYHAPRNCLYFTCQMALWIGVGVALIMIFKDLASAQNLQIDQSLFPCRSNADQTLHISICLPKGRHIT